MTTNNAKRNKTDMIYIEFCKGMREHFGIAKAGGFLCPAMLQMKKVSLDVLKFDDWLHEKFGKYEKDRNISAYELVEAEFGKDARRFCERAI